LLKKRLTEVFQQYCNSDGVMLKPDVICYLSRCGLKISESGLVKEEKGTTLDDFLQFYTQRLLPQINISRGGKGSVSVPAMIRFEDVRGNPVANPFTAIMWDNLAIHGFDKNLAASAMLPGDPVKESGWQPGLLVQRGPDWKNGSGKEGGDDGIGMIDVVDVDSAPADSRPSRGGPFGGGGGETTGRSAAESNNNDERKRCGVKWFTTQKATPAGTGTDATGWHLPHHFLSSEKLLTSSLNPPSCSSTIT
jgi:hypothetical protein